MSKRTRKKTDIYDLYRQAFSKPDLTESEIEELRKPIILLAETICEHIWGQKFY